MSFPIEVSKATMREMTRKGKNAPGQYYTKDGTDYFAYSSLHGRSVGKVLGTLGEAKDWLKMIDEEGEKKFGQNTATNQD